VAENAKGLMQILEENFAFLKNFQWEKHSPLRNIFYSFIKKIFFFGKEIFHLESFSTFEYIFFSFMKKIF
jgi:hypothetical protein